MRLVHVYRLGQPVGYYIERKGWFAVYELGEVKKAIVSESYSLKYLMRIGRAMRLG